MTDDGKAAAIEAVIRITAGQRDCLKLVRQHLTSKDIARTLGISPHTVDMRLRKAMTILGADSRVAAAQILAEADSANERYQRLIYQPQGLPNSGLESKIAARFPINSDRRLDQGTRTSADVGTDLIASSHSTSVEGNHRNTNEKHTFTLATVISGGQRNHLSIGARLVLLIVLAIASIIAFGVVLSALESLRRLL